MNTATLHPDEYTDLRVQRNQLLTVMVSVLCYGSLLLALIATTYLV